MVLNGLGEKRSTFLWSNSTTGGKLGKELRRLSIPSLVSVPPYYPDIALVRKEIAHHYDCLIETDKEVGKIITL